METIVTQPLTEANNDINTSDAGNQQHAGDLDDIDEISCVDFGILDANTDNKFHCIMNFEFFVILSLKFEESYMFLQATNTINLYISYDIFI